MSASAEPATITAKVVMVVDDEIKEVDLAHTQQILITPTEITFVRHGQVGTIKVDPTAHGVAVNIVVG